MNEDGSPLELTALVHSPVVAASLAWGTPSAAIRGEALSFFQGHGTAARAAGRVLRGLADLCRDAVFRRSVLMRTKRLTTQQRQEIFHALVTTQDMGLMTVAQSHQHIIKQFDISDEILDKIIEEGLEKEWPPLTEAVQEVS
jgi:hypothetical protein